MTSKKLVGENLQLILTLIAVVAGILFGFVVRQFEPSPRAVELIGFPGEILMAMLKMMILPLIGAALISGLSQLDAKQSGRISGYAFWYYGMTTTLAVVTGIVLVLVIHPGDPNIKSHPSVVAAKQQENVEPLDKFLDLIRNIFPDNIVQASFQTLETARVNKTMNGVVEWTLQRHYVNQMNVLGIIVFCITMGIVISLVGEPAKPLKDFFVSLDIVIAAVVGIIMWYSPIGIFSLIAAKILEIADLIGTVRMLAIYMGTVILGLAIHLFGTLPLIYFLASRRNPYEFMRGLTQAAMTALGTASSAASLPVTFRCLEENNHVEPKFTKFVLPIGSVVNMDGTALYEAVASVFIAQLNGVNLSAGQVVTVSLTATLASIGAASIPSAGLVTMIIVLTAVGLPADDITMIIAVDWFLDRLRTCVNVLGDGFGCGFVQQMFTRNDKVQPDVRVHFSLIPVSAPGIRSRVQRLKFQPTLLTVDVDAEITRNETSSRIPIFSDPKTDDSKGRGANRRGVNGCCDFCFAE
ncbi:Excitatory amino acid transporter [Aphelenchoides besseyi]|nr:Excitatory amino acid transporter [Aphelenchoides besseyi]